MYCKADAFYIFCTKRSHRNYSSISSSVLVLAVGREDGLVSLHSVEDGHLLHEFSAGAAITQLEWTQQCEERCACVDLLLCNYSL